MSLCFVKPAFVKKPPRQIEMNQIYFITPDAALRAILKCWVAGDKEEEICKSPISSPLASRERGAFTQDTD